MLERYAQAYARELGVAEGRVRAWVAYMILAGVLERATVVEEYWLEDLIKKHAASLGSKAGPEAAALFRDRVAEVFGRDGRAEWSHVFRPAVRMRASSGSS